MLGSGRFLYKQFDSIPKVFSGRPKLRSCASKAEEKIIIPARIEREPTDILKALASTVNLDPTAFHYKFADDPYLYTYSQTQKRVFALSMESGRKSAKWVIKENPGFFKHQLAEPPIQAFLVKNETTSEKEVTEQSLLNAIEERNVLGAVEVYKALKSQNVDVQKSTKQSLLELVCFYNEGEKPDLDVESKWFDGHLGKAGGEIKKKKEEWNATGFANSLFEEMDSNCPLTNSAIIQGMIKYNEIDSALKLYESAKVKNIKLSVGAYNSILSESLFIVSDKDIVFFIVEMLKEMSTQNVKPNLGTLNAALKALCRTSHLTTAENLVKEFALLGIRPSLGSYGYLFQMYCRSKSRSATSRRRVAEEIMGRIENQEHEILHPSDLSFFVNTMDAIVEGLKDCDLALRLNDMYSKYNMKFMVRAMDEHAFYKKLFLIVFRSKPIDFAMDIYRRYVFTCFCPEARVVSAIIAALHENFSPEYLNELWEDFDKLGFSRNRPVLGRILTLMKDFTDEASLKIFHRAAINFMAKMTNMTPGDEDMLPDILMAFLKNEDEEGTLQVTKLVHQVGFLHIPESTVKALLEFAMSRKSVPLILESLSLADRQGLPATSEMARECLPLLSGHDEAWARGLITEHEELSGRRKPKETEVSSSSEDEVYGRSRSEETEERPLPTSLAEIMDVLSEP